MIRAVAVVALIALVSSNAGCSFVFTESVPDNHPAHVMPTCTASRGTLAVDATFAASLGLVAMILASIEEEEDIGDEIALTFGIPAALFTASGIVGIARTNRCREARAAHEQWLFQNHGGGAPRHSPSGPPGAAR